MPHRVSFAWTTCVVEAGAWVGSGVGEGALVGVVGVVGWGLGDGFRVGAGKLVFDVGGAMAPSGVVVITTGIRAGGAVGVMVGRGVPVIVGPGVVVMVGDGRLTTVAAASPAEPALSSGRARMSVVA